jgi:hypothetical protein
VFPEELVWLAVFWWVATGVLAVYLALFLLARRPVALRLGRLEWFALTVIVFRLGMVLMGYPLEALADMTWFGITLLAAVALRFGSRAWLVRAEAGTLREQIETACRGLFLECAEPAPGEFVFTHKGNRWRLCVRGFGKQTQLVILPRVVGPGKVALLVHWLSKQYPGPIPRIRIVLKKE